MSDILILSIINMCSRIYRIYFSTEFSDKYVRISSVTKTTF